MRLLRLKGYSRSIAYVIAINDLENRNILTEVLLWKPFPTVKITLFCSRKNSKLQ